MIKTIRVCCALLFLLTIAGFCGAWSGTLGLASHFRVQYAALAVILTILSMILRSKSVAFLFAAVSIMNFIPVAAFMNIPETVEAGNGSPSELKLISINLYARNIEKDLLLDFIDKEDPDIIVLQEVTRFWAGVLKGMRADYPHMLIGHSKVQHGAAILSKRQWIDSRIVRHDRLKYMTVHAEMEINDHFFSVIGVHLSDPGTSEKHRLRVRQAGHLIKILESEPSNLLLAGDLNATPWSHMFKKITEKSGLRFGESSFTPTWPTWFKPLLIPIDHILSRGKVVITKYKRGPDIGSDHFPIIAYLNIVK